MVRWKVVISPRRRVHGVGHDLFVVGLDEVVGLHLVVLGHKCDRCQEWGLKELISALWLCILQVCYFLGGFVIFKSVELVVGSSCSKPVLQINIWVLKHFFWGFGSICVLLFKVFEHVIRENFKILLTFLLQKQLLSLLKLQLIMLALVVFKLEVSIILGCEHIGFIYIFSSLSMRQGCRLIVWSYLWSPLCTIIIRVKQLLKCVVRQFALKVQPLGNHIHVSLLPNIKTTRLHYLGTRTCNIKMLTWIPPLSTFLEVFIDDLKLLLKLLLLAK